DHDVYELYGNYYLVVVGHTTAITNQSFTLSLWLTKDNTYDQPVTTLPIPTNYATPPTNTGIETLILVNPPRFNTFYPGTSAGVVAKVNQLANDPSVNGVVVDLDAAVTTDTPPQHAIHEAYAKWDSI